jgi:hypothetical protein
MSDVVSLSTPPKMYRKPKSVRDFMDENGEGLPGAETSGSVLTYAALDAYAASVNEHRPCEILIAGEFRDHKGRRRLIEATNVDWVLAMYPGYRLDKDGNIRDFCVECEGWQGKHSRSCKRG